MAEFVVNQEMFGRYVRIPTGYSKHPHTYKVVSAFESNCYCDMPLRVDSEEVVHKAIVPVLNVIHCGIDETRVQRVALIDCQLMPEKDRDRHAHWTDKGECSGCGGLQHSDSWDMFIDSPWCPHCGARMDEQKK